MKDGSEGGYDVEDVVVAAEAVEEVGAESANEAEDELEMAADAADMNPPEHVIEAA